MYIYTNTYMLPYSNAKLMPIMVQRQLQYTWDKNISIFINRSKKKCSGKKTCSGQESEREREKQNGIRKRPKEMHTFMERKRI